MTTARGCGGRFSTTLHGDVKVGRGLQGVFEEGIGLQGDVEVGTGQQEDWR